MPHHDDRPDADLAITVVFLIVMIAVLLFLLGSARPYTPAHMSDIAYHSVPAVPPM
jgi:hypothetical protein